MFSKRSITTYTSTYSDDIQRLKHEVENADAILIGAGAGLSTSAGFTYSGERFEKYFSDFHENYGIEDMYSGGFFPYGTLEEYWAWWSRQIYCNRYDQPPNAVYENLLGLVKGKDYFVLTTNVDHLFQNNGFDKKRLFYTQGDFGLWQCPRSCGKKTYDNEQQVRQMIAQQKNMKIPTDLIPQCPTCGRPLTMNLRCDNSFLQDDGWYAANNRYEEFIRKHKQLHLLYLELGVGSNTPALIKYPFWQMTRENPKAVYACVNQGESFCPSDIAHQSICLDADIGAVLTAASQPSFSPQVSPKLHP